MFLMVYFFDDWLICVEVRVENGDGNK